jgi:hypothetical protein
MRPAVSCAAVDGTGHPARLAAVLRPRRPWGRSAKDDEQNGRGPLVVTQLARNFGRTGDDQAGWTVWFECE